MDTWYRRTALWIVLGLLALPMLAAPPAPAKAAKAAKAAKPRDIKLSTGKSLADLAMQAKAAGNDLVFTPVTPCRVIDTRLAGGRFAANETRTFIFRGPTTDYSSQGGAAAGCGIPGLTGTTTLSNDAKAVAINIIAVGPLGPGDFNAWPSNQSIPTASVVNYSDLPGLNIANGVIVPMCDEASATPCASGDISFKAEVSGTFLVVDITGYFHTPAAGITSVNAGTGLTGGGSTGDVTLSLDTPFRLPQSCTSGQIPAWNSVSNLWECTDASTGDITGVAASTGLSGGGTSGDVSLSIDALFRLPQSCTNGQIPAWNSVSNLWECADAATGDITAVTASTGLAGGGTSGDVSVSIDTPYRLPQGCADGKIARWNNGSSQWVCSDDLVNPGDITGVAAGTGLAGGGTTGDVSVSIATPYQLPQTCTNGQVAKWNSTLSQWECLTVGGVGFTKANIYEEVNAMMVAAGPGTTATNTASCLDANDIPLEGTCRPVASGTDNVVIASEQALNWSSTTNAAQFRCIFRNDGTSSVNTQTRILCVTVP